MGSDFLFIAKVTSVPDQPTLQSSVEVQWYCQERAPHKPRWLRYFHPSKKPSGQLQISNIILYDFKLTNKRGLQKKTRDYLKDNHS